MAARKDAEIRRAGRMERYHITRHHLGFDSCVLVAAQYHSSSGTLGPLTLFPALAHLIHTHAALSVHLTGDLFHNPAFSRLPSIDLSLVVQFVQEEHTLQQVAEDQLSKAFDTSSNVLPLWRLVVLPNGLVFFAYHHAIGDGMSGLAFHRGLLAALNTPFTFTSDTIVQVPTNITLVPPLEHLTPTSPSPTKLFKTIFNLYAPTSWTRRVSAWTGTPVSYSGSLRINIKFIEFTPSDITQFKKMCREHGTTLTAAFHALAVSALASLLDSSDDDVNSASVVGSMKKGKRYKYISIYIPISLRSFTKTSPDAMCDHVSAYHTYTPLHSYLPLPLPASASLPCKDTPNPTHDLTAFWSQARILSQKLKENKARSRQETGLLKFLFGDYEGFFRDKVGKKREGGLELSNVGSLSPSPTTAPSPPTTTSPTTVPCPTQPSTQWQIHKVYFTQNDVVCGAALKMNVVGDGLGGVNVGVSWGEGLGEEFVRRFREAFAFVLGGGVEV
ncbi:hypothetical protein JAAARDRAFT_66485 [Jaapia argillacea MUCL 33604]|uniref:Alcohol acetyltransferase n=1 Tax=Jaapia argillacea MUCL 33604 TaxID=933084 RepID=A0A067Q2R5_9AGAM|nr:hypothetical protein JAAARDRAFT_66485 [Jaapia argillacea MUCL 33604]